MTTDNADMLAGLRRLQRGEPSPPLTDEEIAEQQAEIERQRLLDIAEFGDPADQYDGGPW